MRGSTGTRKVAPRRPMTLAIMVALLVAGTSSFGLSGGPVMTISPSQGPPGTVITVMGEDCLDGQSNPGEFSVRLTPVDGDGFPTGPPVDVSEGPAEADGSWSTTLTVPGDAPPGDYMVFGECLEEGEGDPEERRVFDYRPQPFEVLAAPSGPARAEEVQPRLTG